jgi:hypothetical protein
MSIKPQSMKPQSGNLRTAKDGSSGSSDDGAGTFDPSASLFEQGDPVPSFSAAAASPSFSDPAASSGFSAAAASSGFQGPAVQAAVSHNAVSFGVSSAVSSVAPVAVPSAVAPLTISSTSGAIASGTTKPSAVPSWVSTLQTASIAADMTAADVGGTVTYAGLDTLLADLDAKLSSSKTTLTAAEMSDLKTIVANLNNGMTTSPYLTNIMNSLVNGSAENATWTGGGATSTALGNLAVGASSTQLSDLVGKWVLGTDLPSSKVSMDGVNFSVAYSASSKPLFAASGPSMSDVNQGYLGDCYLMSSLAEVADQNAGLISSMFTSNGNNTYGVKFYVNGVAEYVTVNNSLADGGTVFNSGADNWASLAEKAYAQIQTSASTANSWSTIGNGGAPEIALETITGASQISDFIANGASWYDVTYNASFATTGTSGGNATASVLDTLACDLAKGDDLVLSSETNATDSSGKITLVADHAMSVYGFDTVTGEFEIRNPWGTAAGQTWDTTFEVSLSTLLADGDVITADNIGAKVAAPVLTAQTATQTWKLGQAVNFTLASNTFTDPQAQKLTYRATLSSGAALPSWLSFNGTTGTFTGTVAIAAIGLSVQVTATDTSGFSTSETFSIATPAAAPVLSAQTATQTWKLGQAVNFALASNTFTDPQAEKLSYSATLSSGAALPSWLSFNGTTGTFTGTVANTAVGMSIKVTATDTSGLSTSETFSVTTAAAAPALSAQTATQTWKLGQAVNFTLATNTFTDAQAEKLSYSATLSSGAALPSWLSFNGTTGTFSGIVPNTAAGLSVKVTATDTSGLSVSETFAVATPAAAPMLSAQTATQSWKPGQAVNFSLAATTFTDPQNETLTYTASQASGAALPAWLKFNGATDTFSGTAPSTSTSLSLKVTATNSSGLSASDTFAAAIGQLTQAISFLSSGSGSVSSALTHHAFAPPPTLAHPAH